MSGITWQGEIVSVQPRMKVLRSFDERQHNFLGYVLRIKGKLGGEEMELLVAVDKGDHEAHSFCVGMEVAGNSNFVVDPHKKVVEIYNAEGIEILKHTMMEYLKNQGPPFLGIPPELSIYEARGFRRLDPRTYTRKCTSCIWGCNIEVEIIVDNWNPSRKKYRKETFCFGPKSCQLYKAGPTRKVPGRKGMVWEEEDWVDEENTSHRSDEE